MQEIFRPMQSPTQRNWEDVSRDLTIVATMADEFLALSPDDRKGVLPGPTNDRLRGYSAWRLAEAKKQAAELLRLLEDAEQAWRETFSRGSRA
jgi:hypothetical protein